MDISNYQSGTYIQQFKYKCFLPSSINFPWRISDPGLNILLQEANIAIGKLNSFSLHIPDIASFIRMHIVKEATTSSKIEGTKTEFDEALLGYSYLETERRDDWQEVHNYINAMEFAVKELNTLPISSRLLRETHRILLSGVRGKEKLPGEFRKSQNWIGGASLQDAFYIPPHYEYLPDLMSDLEKFINNTNDEVPHLVKAAIMHYQFESIHPFLDGNGRIGRLMITLYLIANNLLPGPTLYLSDFFERNRQLYYDNLTLVRTQSGMSQWIKFFLAGVLETANASISVFEQIIKLRSRIDNQIIPMFGRQKELANKTLSYLYAHPVVTASQLTEELGISKPTANSIIRRLKEYSILKETTGKQRKRIFEFTEYLDLFRK